MRAGRAEWHQCKRQTAAGTWSIAALDGAGMLSAFRAKTSSTGTRCLFVSSDPSPQLKLLQDKLPATHSLEAFEASLSKIETQHWGSLSGRCRALAAALRSRTGGPLSDIAFCVQAGGGKLVIALSPARIAGVLGMPEPGDAPPLTLDVAYRLTRTGRAVRLVQADGSSPHGEPNTALVNLVVEARRLWTRLSEGDTDVAALAKETGRNGSYITRIVRAAFLAPQVVDAILAGRQHGALTARMLKDSGGIPPRWKDQAARYLPHSNSGASV